MIILSSYYSRNKLSSIEKYEYTLRLLNIKIKIRVFNLYKNINKNIDNSKGATLTTFGNQISSKLTCVYTSY